MVELSALARTPLWESLINVTSTLNLHLDAAEGAVPLLITTLAFNDREYFWLNTSSHELRLQQ